MVILLYDRSSVVGFKINQSLSPLSRIMPNDHLMTKTTQENLSNKYAKFLQSFEKLCLHLGAYYNPVVLEK